jgi:hypothetical protein
MKDVCGSGGQLHEFLTMYCAEMIGRSASRLCRLLVGRSRQYPLAMRLLSGAYSRSGKE